VVETVRQLDEGTVETRPQDDEKATPAPKIHDADCETPWAASAEEVHNHVRGLSPYPGAWTQHGDTRLKLYRTRRAEGTGAPGTVVETEWLKRAQKRRKRKAMFVVDLAVPRDLPEEAERVPGIYLYSVDDLEAVVAENVKARQREAEHAEGIVEATVEELMRWMRGQEIVPTIKAMRAKAETIRAQELERTRKQLGHVPEEVDRALEAFSQALVSKLLHEPTMQLRQCSENGNGEELIEATHQLFRLEKDS